MTDPIHGSDLGRKLGELARNLWWSWQPEVRAIFRELSPEIWSEVHHNPVGLLQRLDSGEVERRVQEVGSLTRINHAHRRLLDYLAAESDWGINHAGPLLAMERPLAYFSAEFGLHHSLPIYSGGLGVLAGDHLKSMSDLGYRSSASASSTTRATSTSRSTPTAGSRISTSRSPSSSCRSSRGSTATTSRCALPSSCRGARSSCAPGTCRSAGAACCCSTPATTPTRRTIAT
jgi:hypothetical protein